MFQQRTDLNSLDWVLSEQFLNEILGLARHLRRIVNFLMLYLNSQSSLTFKMFLMV